MKMIYSIVDSRLSEYARYELEFGSGRRGKFAFNRDWGKLNSFFLSFINQLLFSDCDRRYYPRSSSLAFNYFNNHSNLKVKLIYSFDNDEQWID
jgi:hypothetical protein